MQSLPGMCDEVWEFRPFSSKLFSASICRHVGAWKDTLCMLLKHTPTSESTHVDTHTRRNTLTFPQTQMCTELEVNLIFLERLLGSLKAPWVSGRSPSPPDFAGKPLLSRTHTANKHKHLHTIGQPTEIFRSDIIPISPAYQGQSSAPQHSCSLHLFANPFPFLASFLTPTQQSKVMTIMF